MGGGGKGSGVSQSTQNAEVQVAQGELGIAQQQNARSAQEFNAAFPGFQTTENYYQQLASGDPAAISRAIAPATQQINQQSQGAAERITQNTARGGAQNLALAENQINKGAQIGNAATQGYLSSFQNLAGLAGQGIGQSNQQAGTAISGMSAAGNQYGNIAQQQAEGKSQEMGMITSLAGTGASMAAMCWIAEALWGAIDLRTLMVRQYFVSCIEPHWLGRYACKLYRAVGPGIAQRIPTTPWLRRLFLPAYEWLFQRAGRTLPREIKTKVFEAHMNTAARERPYAGDR